jgi:hypothetical protein
MFSSTFATVGEVVVSAEEAEFTVSVTTVPESVTVVVVVVCFFSHCFQIKYPAAINNKRGRSHFQMEPPLSLFLSGNVPFGAVLLVTSIFDSS